MDIKREFACAVLGPCALFILFHLLSLISQFARRRLYTRLLHYVIYPRLFPGRHLINPTRAEVGLHLAHWALTAFCNIYGIATISQAGLRAGFIAIVHLVPLLAASQMSFVSSLSGASLSTVLSAHQSFGHMAAAQGIFHSIVSFHALPLPTLAGSTRLTVCMCCYT